jgi:hypothetical protein
MVRPLSRPFAHWRYWQEACGAHARSTGQPCRRRPVLLPNGQVKNGRCPNHGGHSTGPRTRSGKDRCTEGRLKLYAARRAAGLPVLPRKPKVEPVASPEPRRWNWTETPEAKRERILQDLRNRMQTPHRCHQIILTCRRIDVWINNAMVTVFSPVWRITPEEFRRVTEVTYLGTVHGTMAALRHMRPANRGTIINVGSALAYRSIPLQAAYCGAKHAVRGFTHEVYEQENRQRFESFLFHAPGTSQGERRAVIKETAKQVLASIIPDK